jgi:hypothetical protein
MSLAVQVFGRRNAETIHALLRPASEKRQGRKSRLVGHRYQRALCGFGRGVGKELSLRFEDEGIPQVARSKEAGRDALCAFEDTSRLERMRLRGLSGARDEFHLAAIVQNLKTMRSGCSGCRPDRCSRE